MDLGDNRLWPYQLANKSPQDAKKKCSLSEKMDSAIM